MSFVSVMDEMQLLVMKKKALVLRQDQKVLYLLAILALIVSDVKEHRQNKKIE